jgi:hypothetical protein
LSAGRPLLAFRPVAAIHRLPPHSQACPLSLRDVLRALPGRWPLPIFRAPLPALARAALLAARQARSAVGLAPGPGQHPERWFDAVARAADELAPRLPVFLSGEVAVGRGEGALERARRLSHRLVEAGLTHLAVDVSLVPAADRARAAAEVAAPAVEREVAVECLGPDGGAGPDPEEAAAFRDELQGWGLAPDAIGVRCLAPEGVEETRAQARRLGEAAAALGETRLVRRGPATGLLFRISRAAGLTAVDDGGRMLQAGLSALPPEERADVARRLEEGVLPGIPDEAAARLEGLAFAEAEAVLEALGSEGTGEAVEAGLS